MKAIWDPNPWYNYPNQGSYYTHSDGRKGIVEYVNKDSDGSEGMFGIRFDDGTYEYFLERHLKKYV